MTPASDRPPNSTPTRSERLDALPFTRLHGRILGASGMGWALDAMDVGLISFVLVALKAYWSPSNATLSVLAAAGFAGMAIGASGGGWLADKIGRRRVFALTMVLYGIATGLSSLAWTMAVLIALRFVVGLGLGAELPVASTLVSEFSPTRIRGRMIVWLEAFWAVGWTLAALIGFFVASPDSTFGSAGWRIALLIGAVPALWAIVIRRSVPESVRFLESKGLTAQAEKVVQRFEASAGRTPQATDASAPSQVADQLPPKTTAPAKVPVGALFGPGLRRRTAGIWAVWFCVNFSYYGAFIWLPTILNTELNSFSKSLGYTLIITLAQLPGYAVAAWLIEKWGRRATLASFLVGSACSAALFSQVSTEAGIIAAGMALSFFNLGAWGALYATTPEIYPTVLRGTGAGWAAGFGRIASILTVLLSIQVFDSMGSGWTFTMFAFAFAVGAAATFLLPEMKAKPLQSDLADVEP